MINSIINVDLHIHSASSEYKDGKLVESGTIENLPVLFGKLEEFKISLFAITDHNRFDPEMYLEAQKICKSGQYPSVRNNLAGVEFDVLLEAGKEVCHIVTLFNVTDQSEAQKLCNEINKKKVEHANDYYSREDYERLLSNIGLDTLLIVHQRCALEKTEKTSRSLSGSTSEPYQAIEFGYINALEYQSPHVEGIIKDNLKRVDIHQVSLVTGSDCHQWECYPLHDKYSVKPESWQQTKMKCLPTFKGVLLALTSPETRINPIEKENNGDFIKWFSLDGKQYRVDPGINVIVGENGSGKSTLLDLLHGGKIESYEKNIGKQSTFSSDHVPAESRTLCIEQSAIVDKYNKKQIFPDEYYEGIDYSAFERAYNNYSSKLFLSIKHNIAKQNEINALSSKYFTPDIKKENKTFYIQVINDLSKGKDDQELKQHKDNLKLILEYIKTEIESCFYRNNDVLELKGAHNSIEKVYRNVLYRYYSEEVDLQLKGILENCINNYRLDISKKSTSNDNVISDYRQKKETFINDIVSAIKVSVKPTYAVATPEKDLGGRSTKRHNGFVFVKEAKFYNHNVSGDFLKCMFNSKFQDERKLKEISSNEDLAEAIAQCGRVEDIDSKWKANYSKFLQMQETTRTDIFEETRAKKQGQTIGELSLTYYKYHLNDRDNPKSLVFIDQPEDNISNNHVSGELIQYFDSMRSDRQIFIVTHNPLLVINLDADNVIITEINNGKLSCVSGCLEDDESNILDYVANNMDGGKESLRKRFKLYE